MTDHEQVSIIRKELTRLYKERRRLLKLLHVSLLAVPHSDPKILIHRLHQLDETVIGICKTLTPITNVYLTPEEQTIIKLHREIEKS